MDDWLDHYAAALGVPPLATQEVDAILDLAREVAHGTERRNAPLAAWLAGRSAADPAAALRVAQGLLGHKPADGSGSVNRPES